MARGEMERAQQISERAAREAAEQAETSVVKLTAASNARARPRPGRRRHARRAHLDGGGRRVPRRASSSPSPPPASSLTG